MHAQGIFNQQNDMHYFEWPYLNNTLIDIVALFARRLIYEWTVNFSSARTSLHQKETQHIFKYMLTGHLFISNGSQKTTGVWRFSQTASSTHLPPVSSCAKHLNVFSNTEEKRWLPCWRRRNAAIAAVDKIEKKTEVHLGKQHSETEGNKYLTTKNIYNVASQTSANSIRTFLLQISQ